LLTMVGAMLSVLLLSTETQPASVQAFVPQGSTRASRSRSRTSALRRASSDDDRRDDLALRAPAQDLWDGVVRPAVLAASVAFAALSVQAAVTAGPALARSTPPPAYRFDNAYADDMHPGCDRRIVVEPVPTTRAGGGDEKSFPVKFSGTDVGPDGIGPIVRIACTDETIEKYKLRSWAFDGRVNVEGTDIDAGDGIHVGRWHAPTDEEPWAGIRWADGNRWIVKEQVAEEDTAQT